MILALPKSCSILFATSSLKKSLMVGMLFLIAISAVFDGSTPKTLIPNFLKPSKRVPSLEPISITRSFSFKSNLFTK